MDGMIYSSSELTFTNADINYAAFARSAALLADAIDRDYMIMVLIVMLDKLRSKG